jgi:hypothetical protein
LQRGCLYFNYAQGKRFAQGWLSSAQVLNTFLGFSKKVTKALPQLKGAKMNYKS